MIKNLNFKNKFKEITTNKTFLICLFLTIIYIISGYWKWLEIGLSIVAFISFIILPIQNAFCIYMYLHCFTLSNIGYESCLVATTACFCAVLLVKYIIGIKKGDYILHKNLLITTAIFLVVSSIISLPNGFYYISWIYLIYFILFYLIFSMRKDFKIEQAMNYLFVGIITSSLLAITLAQLPGFQYYVYHNNERFMAFTNHPNTLYIRVLFCLSYYMYCLLNNKINPIIFTIIYMFGSIVVLSTLSKMGVALLLLFTLITLTFYLIKDFKKRIIHVVIFIIIGVLISLMSFDFLSDILYRFTHDEGFNKGIINSLTTGRDDIWLEYLKQSAKNPFTLLFGNGILSQEVYIPSQMQIRAPHSLYIFLLYRFGIIGILTIGYMIYLMIKTLYKERPKFIAYIPLLMLLIVSLSANTFKSYNFIYVILAAQILFSNCKNKPNKKDLQQDKNQTSEQVLNENKE